MSRSAQQLMYDIELPRDKLVTLENSHGIHLQHLLRIYNTEKPAWYHNPLFDELCTALQVYTSSLSLCTEL